MSQGREAAILASSTFTAHLFCAPAISWEKRLFRAISSANSEVYRHLRGDGGTTLSAVVSSFDGAMLCHVGDSRIYGVMPDRTLQQLSREDTVNAILERQEGKAEGPKDSRLVQFVGMGEEMEAQIAIVPKGYRSALVTSDGAHDIPHSVFQRVVKAANGGPDLIRKLLTLSDIMGGRDNASAILFPIESEAELPDEAGENALLAILSDHTLAISKMGKEASDQSNKTRDPTYDYLPRELGKYTEKVSSPNIGVSNKPERKPAAADGRGRTTKSHKRKQLPALSKADAADRLRRDEPGNEVDVQFSTPAIQSDKDAQ